MLSSQSSSLESQGASNENTSPNVCVQVLIREVRRWRQISDEYREEAQQLKTEERRITNLQVLKWEAEAERANSMCKVHKKCLDKVNSRLAERLAERKKMADENMALKMHILECQMEIQQLTRRNNRLESKVRRCHCHETVRNVAAKDKVTAIVVGTRKPEEAEECKQQKDDSTPSPLPYSPPPVLKKKMKATGKGSKRMTVRFASLKRAPLECVPIKTEPIKCVRIETEPIETEPIECVAIESSPLKRAGIKRAAVDALATSSVKPPVSPLLTRYCETGYKPITGLSKELFAHYNASPIDSESLPSYDSENVEEVKFAEKDTGTGSQSQSPAVSPSQLSAAAVGHKRNASSLSMESEWWDVKQSSDSSSDIGSSNVVFDDFTPTPEPRSRKIADFGQVTEDALVTVKLTESASQKEARSHAPTNCPKPEDFHFSELLKSQRMAPPPNVEEASESTHAVVSKFFAAKRAPVTLRRRLKRALETIPDTSISGDGRGHGQEIERYAHWFKGCDVSLPQTKEVLSALQSAADWLRADDICEEQSSSSSNETKSGISVGSSNDSIQLPTMRDTRPRKHLSTDSAKLETKLIEDAKESRHLISEMLDKALHESEAQCDLLGSKACLTSQTGDLDFASATTGAKKEKKKSAAAVSSSRRRLKPKPLFARRVLVSETDTETKSEEEKRGEVRRGLFDDNAIDELSLGELQILRRGKFHTRHLCDRSISPTAADCVKNESIRNEAYRADEESNAELQSDECETVNIHAVDAGECDEIASMDFKTGVVVLGNPSEVSSASSSIDSGYVTASEACSVPFAEMCKSQKANFRAELSEMHKAFAKDIAVISRSDHVSTGLKTRIDCVVKGLLTQLGSAVDEGSVVAEAIGGDRCKADEEVIRRFDAFEATVRTNLLLTESLLREVQTKAEPCVDLIEVREHMCADPTSFKMSPVPKQTVTCPKRLLSENYSPKKESGKRFPAREVALFDDGSDKENTTRDALGTMNGVA